MVAVGANVQPMAARAQRTRGRSRRDQTDSRQPPESVNEASCARQGGTVEELGVRDAPTAVEQAALGLPAMSGTIGLLNATRATGRRVSCAPRRRGASGAYERRKICESAACAFEGRPVRRSWKEGKERDGIKPFDTRLLLLRHRLQ